MKNDQSSVPAGEARRARRPRIALFGNLRVLCFAAVLAAMSLILGKFLQIPNPFQDVIRLSFENLPIFLSGICFGPVIGAVTGVVADLLGCALYGYSINPLITLGAAVVGLSAGVLGGWLVRRPPLLRVGLSVLAGHLLGSVGIKTLGLAAWYLGSSGMGLAELFLWRLLTYAVVGTAELVILYLILRNRAFAAQIERVCQK